MGHNQQEQNVEAVALRAVVYVRISDAPEGTVRVGLAARLDADRELLARLDDDHYDGLVDKAMWVRQRARIAERIEQTRRGYTTALPEQAGPGIAVTTVAAEWAGCSPLWRWGCSY